RRRAQKRASGNDHGPSPAIQRDRSPCFSHHRSHSSSRLQTNGAANEAAPHSTRLAPGDQKMFCADTMEKSIGTESIVFTREKSIAVRAAAGFLSAGASIMPSATFWFGQITNQTLNH